jgi:hypothetical protein
VPSFVPTRRETSWSRRSSDRRCTRPTFRPRRSSRDLSSAGSITSIARGSPETDRRSTARGRRGTRFLCPHPAPAYSHARSRRNSAQERRCPPLPATKSWLPFPEHSVVDRHYCGGPPHELLGVPGDADAATVKRAFAAASKELHPDRYFGKDLGRYRERLAQIFSRIAEAGQAFLKSSKSKTR